MYGREGLTSQVRPTEHARSRWASRLFSTMDDAALAFVALSPSAELRIPLQFCISAIAICAADNITG